MSQLVLEGRESGPNDFESADDAKKMMSTHGSLPSFLLFTFLSQARHFLPSLDHPTYVQVVTVQEGH